MATPTNVDAARQGRLDLIQDELHGGTNVDSRFHSSFSTALGAAPARHRKGSALTPTAEELATLLEAGLEPREGVPGLFLCRVEHNLLELRSGLTSLPIVPPDPIKLEGGQAQELADAM